MDGLESSEMRTKFGSVGLKERASGRLRLTGRDNIKKDLEEINYECVEWISFAWNRK
jgi:hypothetical protein